MGCGNIAHSFARGLKYLKNSAKIFAVASRTEGKAEAFGKMYRAEKIYNNYEDLVNDPEVDVIYISTTHNFHHQNALLCLNHKKPVLCEKPLTINAHQTEDLINTAKKNKVFLMEAMWTRFFPCILKLIEILNDQVIGEVKHVKADFGIRKEFNQEHRAFNPNLGGGALLDLGIYPITFATLVFKTAPIKIKSSAFIGKTGVDEHSSYLFEYKHEKVALLSSSYTYLMPDNGYVFGEKGYIEIPDFYHPSKMFLKLIGTQKKAIKIPFKSVGYNYEAEEVMKCLDDGKVESEIMSLSESLKIMRIMDTIRSQWGLKYPEE